MVAEFTIKLHDPHVSSVGRDVMKKRYAIAEINDTALRGIAGKLAGEGLKVFDRTPQSPSEDLEIPKLEHGEVSVIRRPMLGIMSVFTEDPAGFRDKMLAILKNEEVAEKVLSVTQGKRLDSIWSSPHPSQNLAQAKGR